MTYLLLHTVLMACMAALLLHMAAVGPTKPIRVALAMVLATILLLVTLGKPG